MPEIKVPDYSTIFLAETSNKTEDPSLLQGSVTFIKETPDRRFCCLPHVPDPRTGQSPGLLQILGKYSCLFILILWLYPVVMEVLRSVKSETGKSSSGLA